MIASQAKILPIKKLAYLIVFFIISLPLWGYLSGDYFELKWLQVWTVPLFIFVLVPVLDWLVGKDDYNPTKQEDKVLQSSRYYPMIACLIVPLHLMVIFWGVTVFSSGEFSVLDNLVWAISCGLISGSIGITVAHELIHKDGKLEPFCGGVLLSSMCYATFKVEHVRGHHVNVSTPKDQSSASKGQSVYPFIINAIRGNVSNAWRLETKRLERKQESVFSWNNELIGWSLLSILLLSVAFLLGGWSGVVFFLVQSFTAIFLLEVINYVEHYGLSRTLLTNGRYERVTRNHSWNSSFLITNILLFQLQRHSDHHETPKRRYQQLRSYADSPQLPAGYATMFLLALIPWLWKKVMDPIVEDYMDHQYAANKVA